MGERMEGFSEIQDRLDEGVEEARQEIESARAAIKRAEEKIRYAVGAAAREVSNTVIERQALTRYLYWSVPEAKVTWIAENTGFTVGQVKKIAGSSDAFIKCDLCGGSVPAKDRSDIEAILRSARAVKRRTGASAPLCSSCRVERDARREKDHQARLQAWQQEEARLEAISEEEFLYSPQMYQIAEAAKEEVGHACTVCGETSFPLVVFSPRPRPRIEYIRYGRLGLPLTVLCSLCYEGVSDAHSRAEPVAEGNAPALVAPPTLRTPDGWQAQSW